MVMQARSPNARRGERRTPTRPLAGGLPSPAGLHLGRVPVPVCLLPLPARLPQGGGALYERVGPSGRFGRFPVATRGGRLVGMLAVEDARLRYEFAGCHRLGGKE